MPLDPDRSIEIWEYRNRPIKGTVVLATAGFNQVACDSSTGLPFHQELLFGTYEQHRHPDMTRLLGAVCQQAVRSESRLERGDVLGPAGPLLPNTVMEAFLVTRPVYFGQDDWFMPTIGGHLVELQWLVPVHATEADWIKQQGPDAFETQLVKINPDLLDMGRKPIV